MTPRQEALSLVETIRDRYLQSGVSWTPEYLMVQVRTLLSKMAEVENKEQAKILMAQAAGLSLAYIEVDILGEA